MTNEEVNKVEEELRKAQDTVEGVGRMLCSHRGTATTMWNEINKISAHIAEVIHVAYKLRYEDEE